MLNFFCCKATSVVDKSTELFTVAKDKVQGGVNEFTQAQLGEALIGEPAFLASESPAVSVVITEVKLKDGFDFSMKAFSLKGVHCKVEVMVQCESAQFDAVLDLEKVVGVEQVDAKVVSLSSATAAVSGAISMETMKKYLEAAVSQRASRAVSDWQNQTFTLENAKSKGAVLIASGVAKGGELLESGKAKGGEFAKVKGAELIASGVAKGGELLESGKAKGGELAKLRGAVLIASGVAKGEALLESGKARGGELIDSMRAKAER